MKERLAIIDGLRTPFCKSGGVFKHMEADELGAVVVRELMARTAFPPERLDEVIIGNVCQPAHAMNIARVIALRAGLPVQLTAHTVHRNCASGMESITSAANLILAGEAGAVLAGGVESMSNVPLLFGREMTELFMALFKARTAGARLRALLTFRPRYLKPIIALERGLTDPACGLSMGMTAEVLSREFHVTRREQDEYALESHRRAVAAAGKGLMAGEIWPVPVPPRYTVVQAADDGPRADQSLEALAKLKPYFDRKTGRVTVGNACPITDGAAAVVLARESVAKELGFRPLGYLRDYAYASLEGNRMGLGPVYATAKLMAKTGLAMKDFGLVELNEAFAAQVIACERAFESAAFAARYLGRSSALGVLSRDRLNVNGGAIALGHPVGASGTRLVVTLLKEMRRRGVGVGLATLCIGGGQGAALALEVES